MHVRRGEAGPAAPVEDACRRLRLRADVGATQPCCLAAAGGRRHGAAKRAASRRSSSRRRRGFLSRCLPFVLGAEQSAWTQLVLGRAHHLQELQHVAIRHRLAVVEALRVIAVDRAQEADVLRRSRRPRRRRSCRARGRAPRSSGRWPIRRRRSRRSPGPAAVDLDGVEREALQVGERGISGAEVVERQLGAGAAQPLENLVACSGFSITRLSVISSLQRALGHDVAAEDVADFLDQVLAEDLPAGDVDRDEQRVAPRAAAPAASGGLVRGAQQHVRAELAR